MRKMTAIVAMMAAVVLTAGAASAVDKTALTKKQDAIAAEYNLAKESNFYFVLDVLGKKLELKARGMVLKSWPLHAMRFWGKPDFAGTVGLTRKTALKAPQRIVIKPGEEESLVKTPAPDAKPVVAAGGAATAPDYDLEALELRDMPKRFSLNFDNGLHITIKTNGAGSGGLINSLGDAWRWYVSIPLRNIFGSRREAGFSELELSFDQDSDAQSIYWHFVEGIKGIVL
jgi:hypothetical protein